jgi:hypothetical protein
MTLTSNGQFTLTEEGLKEARFRGPTRFADGRGGMAQQDFECVAEPRFGYSWRRESRKDRGRQFYTVDGKEIADLAEACRLLALPEDPESPRALMRRMFEEIDKSPKLNFGATHAQNFAECNASAGPFGTVRAWMQRASGAWHGGINAWAETERKAGKVFAEYRWIYNAKHAMHESYRGVYLFEHDRRQDTGLRCALGKKCRACPILKAVETEMEASKTERFPSGVEDPDIDAAKVATCIGHILQTKTDVIDGAFFSTKDDRHDY